MKYLILVKHSVPEIIEDVPAREWLLSKEGKKRARVLAERLRDYQPEVIVSSLEPKAIQTARLVADALGIKMHSAPNLHEHDRSKTTYLSPEAFESHVQTFFDQADKLVFGSESASQCEQRFCTAVDLVLKQYRDQTVIVVTHGTVISLYVAHLAGVSAFRFWKDLELPSFVALDMQSNTIIAKENISGGQ